MGILGQKHNIALVLLCTALFCTTSILAAENAKLDLIEVKIGVRVITGVMKGIGQWQPTADYLTEKIPGYEFKIFPIVNLREFSRFAGEGKVDFIITNPSSYVDIEVNFGASRLLTLKNKSAGVSELMQFGSVIFTQADNNEINDLKDLKGKNLIAVSEPAFGGWTVAWREMKKQNFDPYSDLGKLFFAGGDQRDVIKAVKARRMDAGVVRSDMIERMANEGEIAKDEFKLINPKQVADYPYWLSTELYPEWAFAKINSTSDELAQKVTIALLQLSSNSKAAEKGNYSGWTIPLSYQPVHDLMKELNIGPYKVRTSHHIDNRFDYQQAFYITLVICALLFLMLIIKFFTRKSVSQSDDAA